MHWRVKEDKSAKRITATASKRASRIKFYGGYKEHALVRNECNAYLTNFVAKRKKGTGS